MPSTADLNRKLKFSRLEGVIELVKAVSRAIVPTPLDLASRSSPGDLNGEEDEQDPGRYVKEGDWVGTGDVGLDGLLGGGLRVGSITEITGER